MRKYAVAALFAGITFFTSCQEIGPAINFEEVATDASDTTYVVNPVPSAVPRNVYVEEFTGVSCPNCPAGHTIVKSLKTQYGDRVVAVGLYKVGLSLTAPVNHNGNVTSDDFRVQTANDIDGAFFSGSASSLPIAGIDRVKHNNLLLLDRNLWTDAVQARLAVASPLKLEAVSDYNETDSMLKVKITATFTSQVNEKVFFAGGVIQDSIIDLQEDGLNIIEEYEHDHVFRGLFTANGVNGIEFPFSNMYEPGRVFYRTINVKLFEKLRTQSAFLNTSKIKPQHCKIFIIAYHKSGTTTEILQALEVDMN